MKPVWTRLALADLHSLHAYLSEEKPLAAARMIERIEKTAGAAARHPEIGRPGRVAGTRELVVPGTPIVIPYRVKSSQVQILAVIHASRRWPDSFQA